MSDREQELEQRVAELENTVQQMLPSRRQTLKGLGTAAGAGLLGFSAGSASADASTSDSDGNIGLPDDRVDIFADGIDANSLAMSDIEANSVTANSVNTGELSGDIAGGDAITNLSGNIYAQPTAPTAQNEGDIWVDTS